MRYLHFSAPSDRPSLPTPTSCGFAGYGRLELSFPSSLIQLAGSAAAFSSLEGSRYMITNHTNFGLLYDLAIWNLSAAKSGGVSTQRLCLEAYYKRKRTCSHEPHLRVVDILEVFPLGYKSSSPDCQFTIKTHLALLLQRPIDKRNAPLADPAPPRNVRGPGSETSTLTGYHSDVHETGPAGFLR